MVELVVGAEGGQRAGADAVGEEDLRRAVDPRTGLQQFFPARRYIIEEAGARSLQGHCPHQQHQQHGVRKQRREPNDLWAKTKRGIKTNAQMRAVILITHTKNTKVRPRRKEECRVIGFCEIPKV